MYEGGRGKNSGVAYVCKIIQTNLGLDFCHFQHMRVQCST